MTSPSSQSKRMPEPGFRAQSPCRPALHSAFFQQQGLARCWLGGIPGQVPCQGPLGKQGADGREGAPETHILLLPGQFLQQTQHLLVSQVAGTLALVAEEEKGQRMMEGRGPPAPQPHRPPSSPALTAWVSESMPPPCSASRRQASSTPQWAAACRGVQPSPSRSSGS